MKTNKKKTESGNPFADTLQVRRICSGDTEVKKSDPKNEKSTKRNEYHIKTQLPDYERRKNASNIDETGLKYFLPERKNIEKPSGAQEKLKIPRQLKRAQLGSEIKMISVNLPRFGRGQAVISSNIKGELDNEKGLNIQTNMINEQNVNTLHYDQPSYLLEDAQKEIDISQNQLEKIQTILKNRNSEESYSLKPKWNSFPSKNISKVNSKERVISTLTTLNKKLNDMQEKYFSGTKNSYKSIRDFSSRMSTQSISEVDITESNSDINIQIEDKEKILQKFHLSRMNLLPNQISEEKGTSIHKNIGDYDDNLDMKQFHVPTEKKATIDITESNSDCILPRDARNNILEKFNVTKIKKVRDNFEQHENINKYGRQLSDKGHNFSTTIPDMILQGNESISDITQSPVNQFERDSFFELFNVSSETGLIEDSENVYNTEETKDNPYEGSGENNLSGMDVEQLRELLLTQGRRSSEKMKSEKSLNFVLPRESNVSTLKERRSLDFRNPITEELKSTSSETHYFDCDSKSVSPDLTSKSSNKKIFYDNFDRYSNLFDRQNHRNVAGNSVPNLSSNRFISCDTITRSDKEVFLNTPLQNDVLKSNYLTKSFTVDSSGNFNESHSNQITKNKSDQFFNGGSEFTKMENKNIKNSKTTKDMYHTLTKALSNSFYKLPPQD